MLAHDADDGTTSYMPLAYHGHCISNRLEHVSNLLEIDSLLRKGRCSMQEHSQTVLQISCRATCRSGLASRPHARSEAESTHS